MPSPPPSPAGWTSASEDVGDIYYTTLLQHVGCTAYAHETAALLAVMTSPQEPAVPRIDSANPRRRSHSYCSSWKGRKATRSSACRDRGH